MNRDLLAQGEHSPVIESSPQLTTPKTQSIHPCQKCGACCAAFRVAFYWREAQVSDHSPAVPAGTWVELTERLRVMKGTQVKHRPKCESLQGRIGHNVSCSIYSERPSACRNFRASFEFGQHEPRCDEARSKHGMKPLHPVTWSEYFGHVQEDLKNNPANDFFPDPR